MTSRQAHVRQVHARPRSRPQAGFSLIEVLVTILILVIGLIGMFGLQVRATTAEMEAYQRAQALALLKDVEARIAANGPAFAALGASGEASRLIAGDGSNLDCAGATGAMADLCDWEQALLGASERVDGQSVGAMIGARGCVWAGATPPADAVAEFFVVVAWQGLVPSGNPVNDTSAAVCAGQGDASGLQRAVVARVLRPDLRSGT